MIPIPSKDMDINKFVDVKLPTKREIFSRVGGFSSGGNYSGDHPVRFGLVPSEIAERLIDAAESYEASSVQVEDSESKESE